MPESAVSSLELRRRQIADGIAGDAVTGLVVQGGGMRGVYSAGVIAALGEAGLCGAFDHVVGASAGGIVGTYFAAGQPELPERAYLDDLSTRRFIDPFRPWKMLDVDFLIDVVIKRRKELDVAALRAAHARAHMVVTDAVTAEPRYLTAGAEGHDIHEVMRATSAIPIVYNRTIRLGREGFVDGGVSDAIPLAHALELGCTDVVVVLTRDPGFRRRKPGRLASLVMALLLSGKSAPLKRKILADDDRFNETMGMLQDPAGKAGGARLSVIYPSDLGRLVSRVTTDRDRLESCANMGREDARRALEAAGLHRETGSVIPRPVDPEPAP